MNRKLSLPIARLYFSLFLGVFYLFYFLAEVTLMAQQGPNNPQTPTTQLIPRFQTLAPKPPPAPPEPPPDLPPPTEPQGPPEPDDIIIDSLLGIKFLSHKDDLIPEGHPDLRGLDTSDIDYMDRPEFAEIMDKYLEKPVSLESLSQLRTDIRLYYKQFDLPAVASIIPEQEISHGTIQIIVIISRLANVRVENNRWFDDEWILKKIRLKRGDRILESILLEDAELIGNNPFISVDPTLGKPEEGEFGETDIVLIAQDTFPVRFFAGYEDTGNDLTKHERLLYGFNWGNAAFEGHNLSYQYTMSPDNNRLQAHSGSYTIPLFRQHLLSIYGSYAKTEGDFFLGGGTPRNDTNGISWQASCRYIYPLPKSDFLRHQLLLGYDFKQTHNVRQSRAGPSATDLDNWIDTNQFALGYNGRQQDNWGFTSLTLSAFYSPGNLTHNNTDAFVLLERAQSGASYTYFNTEVKRLIVLPWDFQVSYRINFQFADKNLPPTEQYRMGGYNSVRGYEEDEVRGDEGYFFNLELRTPPISLLEYIGPEFLGITFEAIDEFQLLGFWDYGVVGSTVPLTPQPAIPTNDENPNTELSSVGVGMRYTITDYLSVRADYGWQLINTGLGNNNLSSSRLHLGVIVSY